MMLKKNSSLKKEFNYNMSGLDIVYYGKQLVKEENIQKLTGGYNQKLNTENQNNSISFITSFSYKFKPTYKIKMVVKGSPADKAGLLKDDVIIKINGRDSYDLTLGQIVSKFKEKKGRKIKMIIERKGVQMKFQFRLEAKI